MSSTSLWWRYLVNACEVKAHLIGLLAKLGAVCFWQPIPSGLNLVVAAILRDSVCAVSLLPCMADCCCMLYTACKVEWFVLTILKADYYYYYQHCSLFKRLDEKHSAVVSCCKSCYLTNTTAVFVKVPIKNICTILLYLITTQNECVTTQKQDNCRECIPTNIRQEPLLQQLLVNEMNVFITETQ